MVKSDYRYGNFVGRRLSVLNLARDPHSRLQSLFNASNVLLRAFGPQEIAHITVSLCQFQSASHSSSSRLRTPAICSRYFSPTKCLRKT